GSVPVAVGMPAWAALVTLTALAAAVFAAGAVLAGGGVAGAGRGVAGTAAATGLLVAVSAALWSLTGPAVTLVELAALTVICAVTAGLARPRMPRSAAGRSGEEPSAARSRQGPSGVERPGVALARLPAVVTSVLSLCALVACAA